MTLSVHVAGEIAGLRADWPNVASARGFALHPFQGLDHIAVWLRTIGAARDVEPVLAEIFLDGRPYMLAPLGIERRRGVRVLTFLDGGVCDYNAPVLATDCQLTLAPRYLHARLLRALPPVDALVFEKMPISIDGVSNPLAALGSNRARAEAYAIPLRGTWRDFEKNALHRAKDSRRKRRRLQDAGAVRVLIGGVNADPIRLLQTTMRLKSARYIARDGADGFDRPGYRDYYDVMTRFGGGVHLSALAVNDEIIAAHWGLVTADAFYCLMLGYVSGGLGQYSPARLLLEDLIAWSFAKGLRRFEFGGGGAAWKPLLGAEPTPLAHFETALTPAGWAYVQARKVLRRRPPPPQRRSATAATSSAVLAAEEG